jgi:hypothetical protein
LALLPWGFFGRKGGGQQKHVAHPTLAYKDFGNLFLIPETSIFNFGEGIDIIYIV